MIDKPLPPTPILPEQFGLPKGKNAEFYYEALLEVRNNDSWELPLLQSSSVEKANSNQGSTIETSQDNLSTETPVLMGSPDLVDDHEDWGEGDDTGEEPELTQELIREVVERAANRTNKNHGRLPGCLEEDIESFLHKPQIPWMTILRRFVGTAGRAGTCYSWKRESRRFGEEQMGRKNVRKLRMVVAMDTSGSISSSMLGLFVTEVNAIASSYRSDITVVQCDAEVQKVIRLGRQKMDARFCGRGGTDFRPVFELIDREPISPNVLLYLTDLYGTFPSNEPRYPVIWIRTPDSFVEEVPFGKIVFMPGGECQ
jgi:predicted metal-dependent peptidase